MLFSRSTAVSLLLGSALFTAPVFAVSQSEETINRNPCGTVVTDDDIANAAEAIAKIKILPRQSGVKAYTFDVYFNVVAANMTIEGGWVPQSQIDAQVKLINEKYVGTGVSWNLVNTTRIISRYWHETVDSGLTQTDDMYNLFRKGRSTSLNVYTVGFYDAGLNGYSTLPVNYRAFPKEDGAVILFETVPGGASKNRQGGTLVHEAGHWLGLRHTFQGGCTGVGDGVDDTPPAAEANFGCPIGVDSCPGDAFPDPIHNYMDYTDETCRTEFTAGQIDLMQKSIRAFRSDPSI